ncbi:MAG TPA: tetratricopeptide repeat protein [Thermosynechococcus sp. M3746_W2019_013]|nr:tetratricopeptide repeat protein [Thermosynechococcus sp. M3746_W2019_013]
MQTPEVTTVQRRQWRLWQYFALYLSGAIAPWVLSTAALAGDPFRKGPQARPISDATEAVFVALFRDGDYVKGKELLPAALERDRQEPLTLTLAAAIAYLNEDWAEYKRYAEATLRAAQALTRRDPLRGNLYQAVGHFLMAGYEISDAGSGPVMGTPAALLRVQRVLDHVGRAEAVNPRDPELNLIRGFMEWGIASNVSFVSMDRAIQTLQTYAAPDYLRYRGLALAYRDRKQWPQALNAVDQALALAPNNPELFYLKAQILAASGKRSQAQQYFQQALAKQNQLPRGIREEIQQFSRRILPQG